MSCQVPPHPVQLKDETVFLQLQEFDAPVSPPPLNLPSTTFGYTPGGPQGEVVGGP